MSACVSCRRAPPRLSFQPVFHPGTVVASEPGWRRLSVEPGNQWPGKLLCPSCSGACGDQPVLYDAAQGSLYEVKVLSAVPENRRVRTDKRKWEVRPTRMFVDAEGALYLTCDDAGNDQVALVYRPTRLEQAGSTAQVEVAGFGSDLRAAVTDLRARVRMALRDGTLRRCPEFPTWWQRHPEKGEQRV